MLNLANPISQFVNLSNCVCHHSFRVFISGNMCPLSFIKLGFIPGQFLITSLRNSHLIYYFQKVASCYLEIIKIYYFKKKKKKKR